MTNLIYQFQFIFMDIRCPIRHPHWLWVAIIKACTTNKKQQNIVIESCLHDIVIEKKTGEIFCE